VLFSPDGVIGLWRRWSARARSTGGRDAALSSIAERMAAAGTGNAIELRGVSRLFGALAALDRHHAQRAAGRAARRARLERRRQDDALNCVTGDFPPTSGTVRFFGEDVTTLPPHERIRRGLRRTYQISLLFSRLTVRENVYLACRGVSRGRFSFIRTRARDAIMQSVTDLISLAHLECGADRLVGELAHGQQRQLEIALALAGAPRFILFDEPAAGLSPTERGDLVAILTALPAHIGYIIIEHDMDVALRVVESVTMMHNGRIFKEGSPQPRSRPIPKCSNCIWVAVMAERRPAADLLEIRGLNVFYGRSHALQGVDLTLEHGVLSLVGRNGMGKTTLCKAIVGLIPVASGSIRFMGEELVGRSPAEIARLGLGYVPQGRRLWPSVTVDEHLRLAAGNRGRNGPSSASTKHSRGWRSGAAIAATSFPAASSRCSRSRARSCSTRICSSWTSRPKGSLRSSSSRSSKYF
jgi:branched-chain amino acid transport system ATP-binding protein